FVGMNTLTLKDLPQQDASSGNSFLSMIMMLSMSIGVALAGTLMANSNMRCDSLKSLMIINKLSKFL
ncbi:hypothetical protein, partial [Acinetobacter baumannii]|uniref:hypothetical protein n=1 Tax=Acinetobacter baumannii TaxID=470 RepID=UPI0011BEB456